MKGKTTTGKHSGPCHWGTGAGHGPLGPYPKPFSFFFLFLNKGKRGPQGFQANTAWLGLVIFLFLLFIHFSFAPRWCYNALVSLVPGWCHTHCVPGGHWDRPRSGTVCLCCHSAFLGRRARAVLVPSGSPRLIWRVWATRLPLSGGRSLRRIPQCVMRAWELFSIIHFPGTGISTAKPLVPLHSGTGVELGGQQGERVLSPTWPAAEFLLGSLRAGTVSTNHKPQTTNNTNNKNKKK